MEREARSLSDDFRSEDRRGCGVYAQLWAVSDGCDYKSMTATHLPWPDTTASLPDSLASHCTSPTEVQLRRCQWQPTPCQRPRNGFICGRICGPAFLDYTRPVKPCLTGRLGTLCMANCSHQPEAPSKTAAASSNDQAASFHYAGAPRSRHSPQAYRAELIPQNLFWKG